MQLFPIQDLEKELGIRKDLVGINNDIRGQLIDNMDLDEVMA